ncbi:MAG: hypothetical protein IT213_17030 [Cytophagales bacterium]|nr:hypothetical protein [Cytophagales bacterium]
MTPGITYSSPIQNVAGLKLAALQYLEYLDCHFRPALEYSFDDYEIIPGLRYSKLFPIEVLQVGEYKARSLDLYDQVIYNLKIQLESDEFIIDLFHNSWVNTLVGPEEQTELIDFEDDRWQGYLDLRIRLINTLTTFYFVKVESLLAELVENNAERYWWISFYVASPKLTRTIEEIDSNDEGRAPMNFYLKCLVDFRDRFADLKGVQFRLNINTANKWSNGPNANIEEITLDQIHKRLIQKLQRFYQKLTVAVPEIVLRDLFIKLSSSKSPTLLVCNLPNFLKNEFHCIGSTSDRRLYEYSILKAIGSELFSFFRLLVDKGIIVGVTKSEIGLLLRYRFLDFDGFSQNNAKTYLERKFFEKKSNDSRLKKKLPVTAKFEAKYPGLLNGCLIYTSAVIKAGKRCTGLVKTTFEKFLLHSN